MHTAKGKNLSLPSVIITITLFTRLTLHSFLYYLKYSKYPSHCDLSVQGPSTACPHLSYPSSPVPFGNSVLTLMALSKTCRGPSLSLPSEEAKERSNITLHASSIMWEAFSLPDSGHKSKHFPMTEDAASQWRSVVHSG